MNQLYHFKNSICGDPQCPGSSCLGCQAFRESDANHMSIQCPHNDSSCFAAKLCGMCQAIKNSLDLKSQAPISVDAIAVICEMCFQPCGRNSRCDWCQDFLGEIAKGPDPKPQQASKLFARAFGGCVMDFIPEQCVRSFPLQPPVKGGHDSYLCSSCRGDELCDNCAENIIRSLGINQAPSNPNVPIISFHETLGPNPNDLCAFTVERMQTLHNLMNTKYRRFQRTDDYFPKEDFKITADLLNMLIDGWFVHKGFEGYNNNCFIIVILFIFSLDKSLIERINTETFAGFLMRYIVEKFRSTLFVERMLIELFRIEAVGLMPESMRSGFMGVSCPNDFFFQLEEHGIVNRSPYLSPAIDSEDSRISASCVGLERSRPIRKKSGKKVPNPEVDGERFIVLQDAISHSVGKTSLTGPLLFQFKEGFNKERRAVPQGAGEMGFPTKKLSVNKKELSLVAFTRIQSTHYQMVLCLGGMFFNFNSLSPANEGHTLPVLSRMTEKEAHSLFSTDAHTCVFRCSNKIKK